MAPAHSTGAAGAGSPDGPNAARDALQVEEARAELVALVTRLRAAPLADLSALAASIGAAAARLGFAAHWLTRGSP